MKEEEITVSKIDVAARQLRLAVRLFFQNADPIPIETLAGASCGVLLDLARKHGVKGVLQDSEMVAPRMKKEWVSLIRESQNFFKHADRDPDTVHIYKPSSLHFRLMEACDLCLRLVTGKHVAVSLPNEVVVFEIWFSYKYSHLLSDPEALRRIMPSALHIIDPNDFGPFCDALGIEDTAL